MTSTVPAQQDNEPDSADKEQAEAQGPGRPREERIDGLVIDATLKLIDEGKKVTVNAVVKESGVSRAAVYRRWSSMTELTAAALDKGRLPVTIDTSGDIKTAIIKMLYPSNPMKESVGPTYPFRRFRKRIELMMGDHDLQLAYWNSHVEPRRRSPLEALRIAQERGEIRADVDLDAALDTIYGAVYYQVVVRGESFYSDEVHSRMITAFELVWAGLEGCKENKPEEE
ncbi:TetR/AcrR family transcriptional regulator [Corynebacterium sp. S7]